MNLEQVRNLLQRRRRDLATRAERVDRDLDRAGGALSPDFSEQAVQVQNDATLTEIGRTTVEEMRCIDEALARLTDGTYGLCKRCGQPIDTARLAARPEAVACRGCES